MRSGDGPSDRQIDDELVRIGIAGLNVGGGVTPQQLLEAMRLTRDGAGEQELFDNLLTVLRRSSEP